MTPGGFREIAGVVVSFWLGMALGLIALFVGYAVGLFFGWWG